jgi:hypothetical protein
MTPNRNRNFSTVGTGTATNHKGSHNTGTKEPFRKPPMTFNASMRALVGIMSVYLSMAFTELLCTVHRTVQVVHRIK